MIPLDIQLKAKLYPIIKLEDEDNEATGEIEKFNFTDNCKNSVAIGKQLVGMRRIDNVDYDMAWISLGKDYFKNVLKCRYYGIL